MAHEDYLPLLLGEAMPCFLDHGDFGSDTDEAINFLSFNWHRDYTGRDICAEGGLSIAEAFSAGLWITVAAYCREYFALKYWCNRYDRVYVSCNECPGFLNAAKKFGDQVQVYDPGHRQLSPLRSQFDRVLDRGSLIDWRANLLRNLQAPFLRLLRHKTLALVNWTLIDFAARQKHWILENAKQPWKGAYFRRVPRHILATAESRVPRAFHAEFTPVRLANVLQRIGVRWDAELLELLSETMVERYRLYRGYFVSVVALYWDMLDCYAPDELVVSSEFYERHLVAAQLARARGVKVSWLGDGYPVVDIPKRIGNSSAGLAVFDRIYAAGNQHRLRLLRNTMADKEIVTVDPPILDRHVKTGTVAKRYDALIMTWIPFDLGVQGRNGSRPNTLLEALRVADEAGLKRLAIKVKDRSEEAWVLPVLEKSGYLNRVTILSGPYSDHVVHARRVIGGISSAVGETAYHGIPYYIYEPISNGYGPELTDSAIVLAEGCVARTPEELSELLKRPEGSVIADRALLFGTECPNPGWSWDRTRELYTDWASHWADRSGIKGALQWRGFPLWWASNPIAKDVEIDCAWYLELHHRLRGLPANRFQPLADIAVYIGIVKSLAKDLGKWLLLRLLPAVARHGEVDVWFHSLEANLLDTKDGFYDRMYEKTFLDDRKYGFVSGFIVRLSLRKADFLHPWVWRRRIAGLAKKLQRDVEILDRHFQARDIFDIHFSLIRNYFKFRKFIKPLCRQGIRVGHADFSDILLVEMQKSFFSILPWSLSYAAMFECWLNGGKSDRTLVAYGETLAPMRPAYFAVRRCSARHRWITIQHSTVYRNKTGFYHRFAEFNRLGPDDKRPISPAPDYYFVHGPQSAQILSEFYPADRIRTIGCLKYDRLYRMYGQARRGTHQPGADRVLLLAPSVADVEIILKIFSGLTQLPGWRVILSRHPAVSQERIDEIVRRNKIALHMESDPSKSTIQLIEGASLVVCSYSSIAFESNFLGVPSVRVMDPERPPLVEDEPGIPHLTTQEELLGALENCTSDSGRSERNAQVAQTLDHFFLHFDGMASARFWQNLQALGRSSQSDLRQTQFSWGGHG